ncbi:MAG: type II toxin-antitoxin system VapC family toxin [Hyphomonadaceae bacterium]|nr:type II toxin-antitoxin system VapC family toxin [Hyphomonadaceae bacterium]
MRLLLDTHALIWWFEDDPRLSQRARAAIGATRSQVVVSTATAWECAIKVPTGKLPQAAALLASFRPLLAKAGFDLLDMSLEHILAAGALPRFHGDPFDRVLIAQALAEGMPLVSKDKELDRYGVKRLW